MINNIHKIFLLSTLVALPLIAVFFSQPVNAANTNDFDPENIISDYIFVNKNSMNIDQIQQFLESKNSVCLTNLKVLSLNDTNSDGLGDEPYGKGIDEKVSAAKLIWQAAQLYSINPQVILATLQKEQGLITRTDCPEWRYNTALGYGCPDTAPCDNSAYGFTRQIDYGVWHFQGFYNDTYPVPTKTPGVRDIRYNPDTSCGSKVITIKNRATAALYSYTPYQPNAATLAAAVGQTVTCGAYGNLNFWRYFTDWFGSTQGYMHNGVSYADVFNAEYYLNKYPDVREVYGSGALDAFRHFVDHGMKEARQGSVDFDVNSYKNRHPDLRMSFGANLPSYYLHYITNGKAEGRIAIGNFPIQYITVYNGINYSAVYNFTTYLANYSDMRQKYSNDDAGALQHFATQGINEGRQGNGEFNVDSYRSLYYDLRRVLNNNLRAYYMHYITNGKAEGRTATGNYLGGTTVLNNVNYAAVYNFNDYETINPAIKNAFGLNDIAALQHFVTYGMSEGWQASTTFSVHTYKARYPDLQTAFGNSLKAYYMHYITNGKAEGRSGI